MVVFYNMIDITAINAMTIWLYQNPTLNTGSTNIQRKFLVELSKALTNSQNQRRSQESRLKPKVKLALLALDYHVPSKSMQDLSVNTHLNRAKRRCYLCPSKPGRKVR